MSHYCWVQKCDKCNYENRGCVRFQVKCEKCGEYLKLEYSAPEPFVLPESVVLPKSPKLLITGVCGYLGSCLAKMALASNYEVVGYDNCSGRTTDSVIEFCSNKKFSFIKGDILDKDKLSLASEGCDFIAHAAAMVGEPICKKYPQMGWLINYDGSKNVADLNIPTVFFSTGSCYGKLDNICTEESECNPLSVYAKSKLEAEKYFLSIGNSVILRFATAYGLTNATRLDLLPNDFCYQAWKNKALVVAEPSVKRTFCHARDLVSAVMFSIQNFGRLKGEIYNVGDEGGNWSKQQLVDFIQKQTGCSVFYDNCYHDLDLRDYEVSYKKINGAGWKASVTMEEGIEELLKAMPLICVNDQYRQRL